MRDQLTGLSVSVDGCNVIASCCPDRHSRTCKLKKYTTHGRLVRDIRLPTDVVKLSHAVQLTVRFFVVCHGVWSEDRIHGVSIVDVDGRVMRTCSGPAGGPMAGGLTVAVELRRMTCPRRIAVDGNGAVLVTDQDNKRVLLLNQSLTDVRELVTLRDVGRPSWKPFSLFLDEAGGRLIIGDRENGETVVFRVRDS